MRNVQHRRWNRGMCNKNQIFIFVWKPRVRVAEAFGRSLASSVADLSIALDKISITTTKIFLSSERIILIKRCALDVIAFLIVGIIFILRSTSFEMFRVFAKNQMVRIDEIVHFEMPPFYDLLHRFPWNSGFSSFRQDQQFTTYQPFCKIHVFHNHCFFVPLASSSSFSLSLVCSFPCCCYILVG